MASSPTHAFPGFLTPVLHTTIFPSNWLLFHIDLVHWWKTNDACRIDFCQSSERKFAEPGFKTEIVSNWTIMILLKVESVFWKLYYPVSDLIPNPGLLLTILTPSDLSFDVKAIKTRGHWWPWIAHLIFFFHFSHISPVPLAAMFFGQSTWLKGIW